MNFSILTRSSVFFLFITILVSFIWLSGVWPGHIQQDSLTYIYQSRVGSAFDWLSYSVCLLTNIANYFANPIGFVSIAFIGLFAVGLTFLKKLLDDFLNPKIAWVFCALILFNPLILSMNIFYSREVPFALVNSILILFLFDWKYRSRTVSERSFLVWVLLLGIFSELRQDARIYLLAYPLIAYATKIFDRRYALMAFLGSISINLIIVYSCSIYYSKPSPFQSAYQVTATYGVLMAQKSFSREDLEDLYPVVQLIPEELVKSDNKYSYLLDRTKFASKHEMKNYYLRVLKILMRDPLIFLKERIVFFGQVIGVTDLYVEWFNNYIKPEAQNPKQPELNALGFKREPIISFMEVVNETVSDKFIHYGLYKKILFSNLFPLILTLILLFSWSFTPLSSAVSLIFLIKFIIIFLLSPLCFANYFYICYFGAYLVLPLSLYEVRRTSLIRDLRSFCLGLKERVSRNEKLQACYIIFKRGLAYRPTVSISEKLILCYFISFFCFSSVFTFFWKQIYFDSAHFVFRIVSDRIWIFDKSYLNISGALFQTPALVTNWVTGNYNLTIWSFCFSVIFFPLIVLYIGFFLLRKKVFWHLYFILILNFFILIIPVWSSASSNYWQATVLFWLLYVYVISSESPKTSIITLFSLLLIGGNELNFFFTGLILILLWKEKKLSLSKWLCLLPIGLFQLFQFLKFSLSQEISESLSLLNNWSRNPVVYYLIIITALYLSQRLRHKISSSVLVVSSLIGAIFLCRFVIESDISSLWFLNHDNRLLVIPSSCYLLYLGYDLFKIRGYALNGMSIIGLTLLTLPSFFIEARTGLDSTRSITNLAFYMKSNEGCRILKNEEKKLIAGNSILPDWNLPYLTVMMNESSSINTIFFNPTSSSPFERCNISKDKQNILSSDSESTLLHDWGAYYFAGIKRNIAGEVNRSKVHPLELITEFKRSSLDSPKTSSR